MDYIKMSFIKQEKRGREPQARTSLIIFSPNLVSKSSVIYPWFSHDVTKIQTKKLSILARFNFHDALEQLKLIVIQIFSSKGFLVL